MLPYLVREIPNKQQDVVWLGRHQVAWRSDTDRAAGQIFKLFILVRIGEEPQDPLAEIGLAPQQAIWLSLAFMAAMTSERFLLPENERAILGKL
jgi:hypothetical protein